MSLLDTFKSIRTFVFDVDGVLTDGTLLVFQTGEQVRKMHIKDGFALQLAIKKGYRIVIISGSYSDGVILRLQKLGVTDIFMRIEDKKACLDEFLAANKLKLEETLFMGDDIPDYAVMRAVVLPCAPSDAVPEIKRLSRYISIFGGGQGCVRDVIEKTLKLNGDWELYTDIPSK